MGKSRNPFYQKMGQRKLLLMEVKFLTQFTGEKFIVVYAGSSPGSHIPFLADLFPNITFHLYDPLPYQGQHHDRIVVYQQYFTLEDCTQYVSEDNGRKVLFISDIRGNVNELTDENAKEIIIDANMKLQQDFVLKIQPISSLLKFRLPGLSDHTKHYEYLDGDIIFQPWARPKTYETRLITRYPYILKNYNINEYFYTMMERHKQRTLLQKHTVPLKRCPGLCYCTECNEEISIWKDYGAKSNTEITNLMKKCSTNSNPLGKKHLNR